MNDLLSEFASMATTAVEKAPEWLVQQGVPRSVLYGPHASVVGVARIETDGRHYQPVPEGQPAIAVPVSYSITAAALEPIDIAAWVPSDPSRWYVRTGYGDILGAEAIDEAAHYEVPLPVYSTPLAWLQAGMGGACLLNLKSAASYLTNADRIFTDTEQLSASLRRAMARHIQMPTVKTMENLNAA